LPALPHSTLSLTHPPFLPPVSVFFYIASRFIALRLCSVLADSSLDA
jgi:hypothetical protein